MAVPAKVESRLSTGLKRFQSVISSARARDVNESDTVTIVADVLAELFGYDKYSEITSEHTIRGTFCDLAIRVDGKLRFLVEVKAVGIGFKDGHVKQAVDYAANQGVDWVVLTNAATWRVYRLGFGKPIEKELVLEIDLLSLNPRSRADIECIALLTREGLLKSTLEDYHAQRQATSRFLLGALLLSDPSVQLLRRELRHLSPDVKVSLEDLRKALAQEVLKREVVEGEEAAAAQKRVAKASAKATPGRRARSAPKPPEPASVVTPSLDRTLPEPGVEPDEDPAAAL